MRQLLPWTQRETVTSLRYLLPPGTSGSIHSYECDRLKTKTKITPEASRNTGCCVHTRHCFSLTWAARRWSSEHKRSSTATVLPQTAITPSLPLVAYRTSVLSCTVWENTRRTNGNGRVSFPPPSSLAPAKKKSRNAPAANSRESLSGAPSAPFQVHAQHGNIYQVSRY